MVDPTRHAGRAEAGSTNVIIPTIPEIKALQILAMMTNHIQPSNEAWVGWVTHSFIQDGKCKREVIVHISSTEVFLVSSVVFSLYMSYLQAV